MKSMTGYAKGQCTLGNRVLKIEVKTLNSKQMDANVKIPFFCRSKELEIRSMLNRLERGKVDFLITEELSGTPECQLNQSLLESRFNAVKELAGKLSCSEDGIFRTLLAQSDVWNSSSADELSEEDWLTLRDAIEATLDDVDRFREHEGSVLERDFAIHVDAIEQRLHSITQYESERIQTAKDRISKYFEEFAIKDIDQNRFEQELIYYLEKLDITEEKVRLQKHIDYFRDTVKNEPSCGKKLAFVAQEMGREINTTGSKANHVEIQKLVVEMKDELEKIKEQLGNIL